ncbi:GldM family protein [Flavobacterium cheniae]|uniref:GldM-like protein n=1 Tax=Flavobacterium cheniae TaxID=295428 RepID=A0A562KHA7_9FLAO|nr:GldM family protein [Flavobacterium cheniae]TDR24554.1 GldM-like protein [Flavobacterium cheniae]TWH94808.1 GldM-like protein [Flavobacterium cheniae]
MKKLLLFLFIISFHSYAQDTIPASKSVIALDKMNVVYRGVENHLSIAVNGAKSSLIYGNGVSKNKEGKYVIRPGSGNETKVFVEIENFDGSKVVEEHIYKIVNIPMHQTTINGDYSTFRSSLEFKIEELIDAEIGVKFIDCFFINCEVTQFNLKVGSYPTIIISGNKLTPEALKLIKKARKKDVVLINQIKGEYNGFDGLIKTPRPIVFKIIK